MYHLLRGLGITFIITALWYKHLSQGINRRGKKEVSTEEFVQVENNETKIN